MDRFYDEQYVRLRNRKLDKQWRFYMYSIIPTKKIIPAGFATVDKYYLYADDDGEGVSISQRRNSLNVAWKVHIYHGADSPYLLLHSAAYGRYLAATATEAPSFHHGFRAQLRDYDHPVVPEIMWLDIRAGRGRGVLLQNGSDRYLRANGKYLRWNTGVTVENRDIEKVKARLPDDLSVIVFGRQPGAWRGIRCVQASADGLFPEAEQGWLAFHFRGRSLYHLRDDLARQVNQQPEGIAMCIRAGRYGRPTPLVVDLPRGGWGDILQIAVIVSGTPAYDALRYPNVGGA